MFKQEGYDLMGAAFEVYNVLGYGMAEEIYQQSLEIELGLRNILFVSKAPFVWYLFQTRSVRSEIGNRATGTSGSMKNISKAKLFGIPTILPPFHLQQKSADRITAVAEMQHRQKESLTELDQLFASLQHRAFRGEL